MTPTNFEINVALVMIAVTVIFIQWFRKSEAAHSSRRMMAMMRRFSLDPGLIFHGLPEIRAILKPARRRCGACRVEGLCDRWLAVKAQGENDFCPNMRTFLLLR